MEYLVEGQIFSFSYSEVKEQYKNFCDMSDEEFTGSLPAAAHLACFICFIKEIPTYIALSDKGIVHELIHLMHIPDDNTTSLQEIRELFKSTLKLS